MEATHTDPSSYRMFDSIARINFLHNRYRRKGQISDEDMLYTLSLFVLEPSRWTSWMDWRGFSEVEMCAEGVVWRDIGEAMEIPYGALEGYEKGDDGLTWFKAIERWSLAYEREKAVPDEKNRKVALGTVDILLANIPLVARPFLTGVISAVIDGRTRTAMK